MYRTLYNCQFFSLSNLYPLYDTLSLYLTLTIFMISINTKYIKEIVDRLRKSTEHSSSKVHKDWVLVILTLFRQHLEANSLIKKYPVLFFYCNWNVHPSLDRGIVQDFLGRISNVINNDKAGHPADRISEILSMSHMRNDIRQILKQEGFESGIFEIEENWIIFTELMFQFLLNKPLYRKKESNFLNAVESLELYNNNGKLFWSIKVSPNNREFIGPVMRVEQ